MNADLRFLQKQGIRYCSSQKFSKWLARTFNPSNLTLAPTGVKTKSQPPPRSTAHTCLVCLPMAMSAGLSSPGLSALKHVKLCYSKTEPWVCSFLSNWPIASHSLHSTHTILLQGRGLCHLLHLLGIPPLSLEGFFHPAQLYNYYILNNIL